MSSFTCPCQTNNTPHVFPQLTQGTVEHGQCDTNTVGDRIMRVTYTDGTTQEFPAALFLTGVLRHDTPLTLCGVSAPVITRNIHTCVEKPTPINMFRFRILTECYQHHQNTWDADNRDLITRQDLLNILNKDFSPYLDVSTATTRDIQALLKERPIWYHTRDGYMYGYAQEMFNTLVEGKRGDGRAIIAPIPYQVLTDGDMTELIAALNHDTETKVPHHTTVYTDYAKTKVIRPVSGWVKTVFHQYGVWGCLGFATHTYQQLTENERAEVDRAIRAYHWVHHALTTLGCLSSLKKAHIVRDIVNDTRAHLKTKADWYRTDIPGLSTYKALNQLLPHMVRHLMIGTSHYDGETGKAVPDVELLKVAARFVLDHVTTVPVLKYHDTYESWAEEQLCVAFRLVDVEEFATRVAAGLLNYAAVEGGEDARELFDLPESVLFAVLGIDPVVVYAQATQVPSVPYQLVKDHPLVPEYQEPTP